MLHRLWRAIVRDAAPVTRKMASSALNRLDFRRVGFLNSNPVSELRNCGVYGLGMITYFAEKYPDEYMAMLRYQIDPDVMLRTKKDPFSQNAKHEDSPEVGRIMPKIRESEEHRLIKSFPPGHGGVHISLMILRMLELDIDTMTRTSPSPFFALISLMLAGEENVLEEFFCVCMAMFDAIFKELEASAARFASVILTLQDRMATMLLQGPRNVADLWLVIDKLRRQSQQIQHRHSIDQPK
eukprot:TRINITY_DN534_c2_g1_i1.p1 TRINITY_DN534_c2_g1~~TRINITY_DN534_c2_g1_i1.p1  ORF type:complete len:240 (-),score=54.46 TRINITY_DN534_c2_g1_i1:348-1067(-)